MGGEIDIDESSPFFFPLFFSFSVFLVFVGVCGARVCDRSGLGTESSSYTFDDDAGGFDDKPDACGSDIVFGVDECNASDSFGHIDLLAHSASAFVFLLIEEFLVGFYFVV